MHCDAAWLHSVPVATHTGASAAFEAMLAALPGMHDHMMAMSRNLPVPQQLMAQRMLAFGVPLVTDVVSKVQGLLRKAHVKQGNNMTDWPLDELCLALQLLAKKPLEDVDPNSNEYTATVVAGYIWEYLTEEEAVAEKSPAAVAPTSGTMPARKRVSRVRSLKSRSQKEVAALVDRLIKARPDLAEDAPAGLLERAGVSKNLTKLLGADREAFEATLFSYLDETAFDQLAASVSKVEAGVAQVREHIL